MEDYKDIQNNKLDQKTENRDKISVFINDITVSYIYRKSEKLSTAIYLLTNFFPEQEPLRFELREKAIHLLDDVLSLQGNSVNAKLSVDALSSSILLSLSLLEISLRSGMLSQMNFEILRDEYNNVLGLLESKYKATSKQPVYLNTDFFKIEDMPQEEGTAQEASELSKRRLASPYYPGLSDTHDARISSKRTYAVKKDIMSLGHNASNKNHTESRRTQILKLLKAKKELSIKDVTTIISHVSEKTIQRELTAMVTEGLIEKKGKKRWSKYYPLS